MVSPSDVNSETMVSYVDRITPLDVAGNEVVACRSAADSLLRNDTCPSATPNETLEAVRASYNKSYSDIAGLLVTFATFAGGLTLSTQFVITCPCSRLEALLELASQLLLAAPFVLLSIYLLLYKIDDGSIPDFQAWRGLLIICQFFFAGFLIAAGFLVLSVALFSANSEPFAYSQAGIAFFALILLITILAGIWAAGIRLPEEKPKQSDCRPLSFIAVIIVCELVVACVFIAYSATNVTDQPVHFGCNPIQTLRISAPLKSFTRYASITSCQKSYGIYTSPVEDITTTTTLPLVTTTTNITISVPTPIVPSIIFSTSVITTTIDEVRGTITTISEPIVTVNLDVN